MTFPLDINQYKILECIGSGSTSQVYRAMCLTNNRIIAIKMIDLELYPLEIDVLRREVAFWSRCHQNENIVDYYGSFINGSVIYILMEYLSGGSVLDIMREKFQNGFEDEYQIATVLKGILLALQYVHQHEQVHRDIKPGNVLINNEGTVKIGDFGVAASLLEEGLKRPRFTIIGTLSYMAPEVLNKEIPYTQKADIWSLGITAYELTTGSSPYQNIPALRTVVQILNSPPPRLPTDKNYSPELCDFVRICLNHKTDNRPTAAELLEHEFIKKAKDGSYLVNTLLSQIPPLDQRSQRKQKIFEELAPKLASEMQAPVWQFPTDGDTSTGVSNQEQKEESVEHKGRFSIHITKQASSSAAEDSSNAANQQSNSPLLESGQQVVQKEQNGQQQTIKKEPENQQQVVHNEQENKQLQVVHNEQENKQLQESQQRKKNLRDQIADLSAKIEQLTRDNEQFRNQLKVLTGRIGMLVKKSQM